MSPGSTAPEHSGVVRVNPDASLFFAEHDSGSCAVHDLRDLGGFADSAGPQRDDGSGGLLARSRSDSRSGHGHTVCRPALGLGTERNERAGLCRRPYSRHRWRRGGPSPRSVRYCPCDRAEHGSGHGADVNLAVLVGAVPACQGWHLPIPPAPPLSAGKASENPRLGPSSSG
jgi:hypothetical protein